MGEIFEVKLEKKKQWLKVIIFTGFTQRTCENVDISIYIEKLDMTQLLLLGKFRYGGGLIFKVVLEC